MENMIYLLPLFFLAALLYSTAGHGGGSTYIAILVLFSLPFATLRQVSLVCNIIVAGGGFYIFYEYISRTKGCELHPEKDNLICGPKGPSFSRDKAGYFSAKKVFPFVLTSIPASFLFGRIQVGEKLFSILLGLSLLVVALRLLFYPGSFESKRPVSWVFAWSIGLPLGAVLGALSGLLGIGGGIFLSPVLMLLGWANSKETATAASFFILVNSIAGLLGQWTKSPMSIPLSFILPLAFAVFLGGQIGSRLGSKKISILTLQRYTAFIVLYASGNLLWRFV